MDKYVVFLDIDGTLVNHGEEVSKRVINALKTLREKGHYVFICTGRNRASVDGEMALGCFDGTVCSAGGYIEINSKKIYEAGMSKEEVQLATDTFKQYGILYMMEATHKTFQSQEMVDIFTSFFSNGDANSKRLLEQEEAMFHFSSLDSYNEEKDVIQTICYLADKMEDIQKPKEILSPYFDFLVYEPIGNKVNGELMKKGIDKGLGVHKVMDYLHIPIENSICFGDSMNDLAMLKACHHSVVMANGDEKVKPYASTICESVHDEGIYHELLRLGLI